MEPVARLERNPYLIRILRLALAAEEEAIHLYEALAGATDHALANKVLQDVANEEREQADEFQRLINTLLPDEKQFMGHGAREVDEIAALLTAKKPAAKLAKAVKAKNIGHSHEFRELAGAAILRQTPGHWAVKLDLPGAFLRSSQESADFLGCS
ncbi:hypothetical protein DFAR_1380021 [Desulfarculales bacterium]